MEKEVLNKKEKMEIKGDVRNALKKAKTRNMSRTEIDAMNKENIKNQLNQKLPIIASILIITTITFGFIYFYIVNNPKTIFIHSLNNLFGETLNESNNDVIQGQITITNNGIKNQVNYRADNERLIANTEGNTLYLKKQNAYFYSDEIADKYIKLDNSINYDKNNIVYILSTIDDSITKALNNQKYTKTKESINIDGKKTNVTATSLNLNEKLLQDVIQKTKENLLNNSDFIKKYGQTFNMDVNSVKSIINDFTYSSQELLIKIYSENFTNKFIKIEIFNNNNKILGITKLSDNKYSIDYNNLVITSSIHKTTALTFPNIEKTIDEQSLNNDLKVKLNNKIKENNFLNFIKGS